MADAPAPTPTLRQLEVLELIEARRVRAGYAPTIRELAELLGVSSTNTVACHLETMATKGFVTWAQGKGRTLSVTEEGRRWVTAGRASLERELVEQRKAVATRRLTGRAA